MAKKFKAREFKKKLDLIENEFINQTTFPVERKEEFMLKFSYFKTEMKNRWQVAHRTERDFLKKNHDWLQGVIEIPLKCANKPGRPSKSFVDLCERSKRRRTEIVRSDVSTDELVYATQMKLRETGKHDAARVVKDINTSPTRGKKYMKHYKNSSTPTRKQLTPTKALSIFIDASLSRKQYEIIRTSDPKLYPCYSLLQKSKKECYPVKEAYRVTESCAEVSLQELLNHTSQRLVLYLDDVLNTITTEEKASLELIYKWGCDGSQQTEYKQKFENSSNCDAYIFQSSLVPLQLTCRSNKKVIWQNPTPSSPRFCRPMRIRFVHETVDITNDEIRYFNEQIVNLEETVIQNATEQVSIKHTMLFTMVDGKVCNSATQTKSTMRCFICKATSKDFNNLVETKEVDYRNLKFGLSTLHARIRFFEFLLHISYKISIKKWQMRTQADKDATKQRKAEIQKQFKTRLGLIVDVPKVGYGNSNDGNTSRRFFENAQVSSEITGIDLRLITRFAVILEVISSGFKINIEKFSTFCRDTAILYVELYSWHPMSPTVHKVLVHGPLVIQHALLPIGTLSEEAAEARNKHFRNYRKNFARKFSREDCNLDVLNRLLLTSDPFMSSIRIQVKKKAKPFSATALEMLLPSQFGSDEENMVGEDNSSDDEEGWELSSD